LRSLGFEFVGGTKIGTSMADDPVAEAPEMHIRFTCPDCARDIAIGVYKVAASTPIACEHCGADVNPITACEASTVIAFRRLAVDAGREVEHERPSAP
jgi:transcription elongation factor Elf1